MRLWICSKGRSCPRLLSPISYLRADALLLQTWTLGFYSIPDEPVSKSRKATLKMMVQKSTNRFLFAHAEEDFAEFLVSSLAIPLGGVAFLLEGNTSLTNIDNLFKGVGDSIADKYLISRNIKTRLIRPKVALHYIPGYQFIPLVEEAHPPLYLCWSDDGKEYLSSKAKFEGCELHNCRAVDHFSSSKLVGNFLRGPAAYIITDDLVLTQFSVESSFAIINRLGIPVSDVKQVDFLIGEPEFLRILKASLTSRSVLTDALLNPMIKEESEQGS